MSAAPADVEATAIRLLVVDDDPWVQAGFVRVLRNAGYAVTTASDVPEAEARLGTSGRFDVVLTDLTMPSGTGLDVLAAAHQLDPTLPVIMITGSGDEDVARQAVRRGALRFLTKPIDPPHLVAVVEEACRARAAVTSALGHARSQRMHALHSDVLRMKASARFDEAMERLWLALQPVASVVTGRIVGYEALLRSDHRELSRPDVILRVAEDLGRLPELGRRIRAAAATRCRELPAHADLLVNLHPADLVDPELFDPESPLTAVASRVILEITERASLTDIPDLAQRLVALRALGYRLAIDDLGAGYGSLSALALVRPELVKLDMSLVRGIDRDAVRTQVVRSLGFMCQQLGTTWLCEGVETPEELRALVAAGVELVQGYLIGRPARPIATEPAIELIVSGGPDLASLGEGEG